MSKDFWPFVKHVSQSISERTGLVTEPEQRVLVVSRKTCDWLASVWDKPKRASVTVENRNGRVWIIARGNGLVRAVSTFAGELPSHAVLPIGRIAWELKYGGEEAFGLHFNVDNAKTQTLATNEKGDHRRKLDLGHGSWSLTDRVVASEAWEVVPREISFGKGFLPRGVDPHELADIGKINGGAVFFGPCSSDTNLFAVCGSDTAPLHEQQWFALLSQVRRTEAVLPGLDGDDRDVDEEIDRTFGQPGFAAEMRAAGSRITRGEDGMGFEIHAGDPPEIEDREDVEGESPPPSLPPASDAPFKDALSPEAAIYAGTRGFFNLTDVQRKFGLDYARADAIRQELQSHGVIGAFDEQSSLYPYTGEGPQENV